MGRLGGVVLSVWLVAGGGVGCKTPAAYVKPYYCESYRAPTQDGEERMEEYGELDDAGLAPKTLAWIREANRICEANNALRDD